MARYSSNTLVRKYSNGSVIIIAQLQPNKQDFDAFPVDGFITTTTDVDESGIAHISLNGEIVTTSEWGKQWGIPQLINYTHQQILNAKVWFCKHLSKKRV